MTDEICTPTRLASWTLATSDHHYELHVPLEYKDRQFNLLVPAYPYPTPIRERIDSEDGAVIITRTHVLSEGATIDDHVSQTGLRCWIENNADPKGPVEIDPWTTLTSSQRIASDSDALVHHRQWEFQDPRDSRQKVVADLNLGRGGFFIYFVGMDMQAWACDGTKTLHVHWFRESKDGIVRRQRG
jgi:hypothetical protein